MIVSCVIYLTELINSHSRGLPMSDEATERQPTSLFQSLPQHDDTGHEGKNFQHAMELDKRKWAIM